ncbi:MAG: hypothetical protein Q3962_09255 [Corynebacterium sp.]|nr:hypothetical protein [Corynebacterium sp.]
MNKICALACSALAVLSLSSCSQVHVNKAAVTTITQTTVVSGDQTGSQAQNSSTTEPSQQATSSTQASNTVLAFPGRGTYEVYGGFGAVRASYGFTTPSRNITCHFGYEPAGYGPMMDCQIESWGKNPVYLDGHEGKPRYESSLGVRYVEGQFGMSTEGTGVFSGVDDSWVVPYDTTVGDANFQCTVDTAGVTCTALATGKTIFVSRDRAWAKPDVDYGD